MLIDKGDKTAQGKLDDILNVCDIYALLVLIAVGMGQFSQGFVIGQIIDGYGQVAAIKFN